MFTFFWKLDERIKFVFKIKIVKMVNLNSIGVIDYSKH